jgi:hypothetical protein
MGNVVDDLKAAVEAAVATARASRAQADADHERVKEAFIQARTRTLDLPTKDQLGPKVLERVSDGYLDRDTISRITSPAVAAQRKHEAA